MYIYTYVYIYISIYIYTHTYICIYLCIYISCNSVAECGIIHTLRLPQDKLFWPISNTKACANEALKLNLMRCLHLAPAVLPSTSPIAAHQTTGFLNRALQNSKTANKLYQRKFVLLFGKSKFPERFFKTALNTGPTDP